MPLGKVVNGHILVAKNGRVGMIDLNGNMVITMNYHYLDPLDDYGFTIGMFWDKYCLIDKNGNQLTELIYDKLYWDNQAEHYYTIKYYTEEIKDL